MIVNIKRNILFHWYRINNSTPVRPKFSIQMVNLRWGGHSDLIKDGEKINGAAYF